MPRKPQNGVQAMTMAQRKRMQRERDSTLLAESSDLGSVTVTGLADAIGRALRNEDTRLLVPLLVEAGRRVDMVVACSPVVKVVLQIQEENRDEQVCVRTIR